jgi:hypothetical protein
MLFNNIFYLIHKHVFRWEEKKVTVEFTSTELLLKQSARECHNYHKILAILFHRTKWQPSKQRLIHNKVSSTPLLKENLVDFLASTQKKVKLKNIRAYRIPCQFVIFFPSHLSSQCYVVCSQNFPPITQKQSRITH